AANIRRLKQRLASVSAAKVEEVTAEVGENARLEDCPADNRVRLFYPGKPDREVRTRLKGAGFRWAPSLGCWQAYRNHRTLETAKREAVSTGSCETCKGTGGVYTRGQVTVECDACVPPEPCAAEENGMSKCDDDHKARGVACGVCADDLNCPRCGTLTHASESNGGGVCATCLGPDAIYPEAAP